MTLKTDEFIRRFLLHVLPDRFVRIRHFGLLANRNRKDNVTACHKMLGGVKNATKRKKAGDLAGATAQNLRNRCHGLFRLSERQNVQNRTTASRQMQQPAGVDEMSTVYLENPIWSSFCEKNPLFRHGVLLPKIEYAPIIRPRMYQSIALFNPG